MTLKPTLCKSGQLYALFAYASRRGINVAKWGVNVAIRVSASKSHYLLICLCGSSCAVVHLSLSLLFSSTDPAVSFSIMCVSFSASIANLMTAFTVEKDGFQSSFGQSKVLALRSFQLLHPPSIYDMSPHLTPTLGRNIRRWASHSGHSSSRCRVESSFCPHSH